MITSPQMLADEVGVEHPDRIAKAIFKATECGCVFSYDATSVTVSGYAEGADAECQPHTLTFPFTMEDFWSSIEEADAEGVEMWHEWNDEVDTGEEA
jgi:hypothetical protein